MGIPAATEIMRCCNIRPHITSIVFIQARRDKKKEKKHRFNGQYKQTGCWVVLEVFCLSMYAPTVSFNNNIIGVTSTSDMRYIC